METLTLPTHTLTVAISPCLPPAGFHQAEATALLKEFAKAERDLPDAVTRRRIAKRAAALSRRGCYRYRALRSCGTSEVKFGHDGEYLHVNHCNLKICPRCGRINAKANARKYLPGIAEAVLTGSRVFFVTLNQVDRVNESAVAAHARLRGSLKHLWRRVDSRRSNGGLSCTGAVTATEAVCRGASGFHFHAHILWVGHIPDAVALFRVWNECSPHAVDIHVHPIEFPTDRSTPEIEHELLPYLTYMYKGVADPKDSEDREDLDSWAEAVEAVLNTHNFMPRGFLHRNLGKKKPKFTIRVPRPRAFPGFYSDESEYDELPPPRPAHPEWLPRTLDDLRERLRTLAISGNIGEDTGQLINAAKRILPQYRRHCEVMVALTARRSAAKRKRRESGGSGPPSGMLDDPTESTD